MPVQAAIGAGPATVRDGKAFPLELGGVFRFGESGDYELVKGEMSVSYAVHHSPRIEGSWVEFSSVVVRASIQAKEDLTGLYFARAWVEEGELIHVAFRPIPTIPKGQSWIYGDKIKMRREQTDGYLWCGVFRDGKPVVLHPKGRAKTADVRFAQSLLHDQQTVGGGADTKSVWQKLDEEICERLALNGSLASLQQWAAEQRSWQRHPGPNLLWRAVLAGRRDVVAWLLEEGVDPESKGRERVLVLNLALNLRAWEIADLLLSHRKGKWSRDEGANPLILAAMGGSREMVQKLQEAGVEWPRRELAFLQPLIRAVGARNAEAVKLLLEHGARVQGGDIAAGSTYLLLRVAAAQGDAEIMRALLARGIDWDVLAKQNYFPIYQAIVSDQVEMLDLLVEAGSDPHTMSPDGRWDFVAVALEKGSHQVAARLLELGVKPVTIAANAAVLWAQALDRRDEETAAMLLEHEVGLPRGEVYEQILLDQALAEQFSPALQAAVLGGWTGDDEMGAGWNVAGLAARYAVDEPVELVSAETIEAGPEVVSPPEPPRMLTRVAPQYPKELWLQGMDGSATLELLVAPNGDTRFVRVLEASREEFGREARRAVEQWVFQPMPEGKVGWRRFTAPFEFNPVMDEIAFVPANEVDQLPVPLKLVAVERPDDPDAEEQGVAMARVLINETGQVMQVRVHPITDVRWTAAVEKAVKQFVFQPALNEEYPVITMLDMFVRYPAAQIVPEEGLPYDQAVARARGDRPALVVRRKLPDYPKELEQGYGIVLLKANVQRNGRPTEIEVIASSDERLNVACEKAMRAWKFRAATAAGEKIEQSIVVPIVFRPPGWDRIRR